MDEQTNTEMKENQTTLPFPMGDADVPETKTEQNASAETVSNFSSSVSSDSAANNHKQNYSSNVNSDGKSKGDSFKSTVADYAVSMYQYASWIKSNGHLLVADAMFEDLMTIIMATNTASEAIGREKFIELLEDGYYASSRMIEYMKFLFSIGVSGNMYEPLLENNARIHKVFGASIKTMRSKKQNVNVGM